MKVVRYRASGGAALGVLCDERQSLLNIDEALGIETGGEICRLLDRWAPEFEGQLRASDLARPVSEAELELLAPCAPLRRNVFCVGKNYREHALEFERSGFDSSSSDGSRSSSSAELPVIFTKATTSVIGPGQGICAHSSLTKALDYEAELAVVIGLGGRGISKESAYEHVFGYTILNDITARDLQQGHKQWFMGKSLDTFCPIGPWVVTAGETDASSLRIRSWVNDEPRQDANTGDLIFDIPTLISTISAGITLLPGDVIATGTPSGVGLGFDPPRFLKPGDVVTVEIEGLGRLTNPVVGQK